VKHLPLLALLLLSTPAAADPDFEHFFDNIGLELRGFSGWAPKFGSHFLYGADAHLLIQGVRWGFTGGVRGGAAGLSDYGAVGSRPTSEQFALIDLGVRMFVNPTGERGVYVALGGDGGATYIDAWGFRNASAWGGWAEVGLEMPRTVGTRFTAALRFSAGATPKTDSSRVPADGSYLMLTLNVGVLFGGQGTGNAEAQRPIDDRLLDRSTLDRF
jgi:hypothetical protein